ncbi:TetR/AcrR family transcriptional regulator [Paenibacillus sp. NPDC056579]|uniref:TetR/AcrR family transcriptional regulator n=1 Tax=unclassified Paenibacillus TaxID=185978 RepID=UPI001EF76E6B|nr:TetR/AcrR family transcriptional regulator [Paenibacillus sp. H1-7]ULL18686.1 TetR/AcrR family transcriptional regulator [Paenibacillus sp. H1-7]
MTSTAIKTVALRHFAKKGYEGTPLSDIAKDVGIKTPSLYAHFRSKEELFLSVFQDVLQEHASRIDQLISSISHLPIEEKLYTILRDSCENYLLDEEKITFLKRAMLFPPAFLQEDLREQFMETERVLAGRLSALFASGIQKGLIRDEPVNELLASYLSLLDGCFVQLFYYGRDQFEQRLSCVWRIYWDGISASKPVATTPQARS